MGRKNGKLKNDKEKAGANEQGVDPLLSNKSGEAGQPSRGAQEKREEREEEEPRRPEMFAAEQAETPLTSQEEVEKVKQEKEEYYDRLLRTQADFDNYRKRTLKEQANLIRYGAESSLREILPVVDNLERAVDSARKHTDSNDQLREGIELILNQFLSALEKLGVRPIETVGHPFDPNKHDALLRVHAADVSEGTVVDEVRKGYYLHDKVLRPAQVTVATSTPDGNGEGKPEEGS
ncbi:MAG: nucleotide exchange factor GrpE [Candidatus Abyssobacteria bacterium SURF_17]|uniref:Protein GrpE n=1 Tax=Candidatus Abyssobacteria bacterium SURF_17 TaxID=2093361 RepID=A0A419EXW9_9BACT|nr:MAG: nucleotide exchange factor GrpE [Candidatus Abyssubacteria bacterium SURF_17]